MHVHVCSTKLIPPVWTFPFSSEALKMSSSDSQFLTILLTAAFHDKTILI